jgi:hypothetical protein
LEARNIRYHVKAANMIRIRASRMIMEGGPYGPLWSDMVYRSGDRMRRKEVIGGCPLSRKVN